LSVGDWCLAVRHTEFFTSVRESAILYPTVLALHLTCIAIFGGMILATDLRLLGLAFTKTPLATVIGSMRQWKQAGFVVMVACGVLLAGSKLDQYYVNPYFVAKLLLLCAVGAHGILFRAVYRSPKQADPSLRAKAAGSLSLLLWLGVLACGRWIAYWDAPDAIARLFDQFPPL